MWPQQWGRFFPRRTSSYWTANVGTQLPWEQHALGCQLGAAQSLIDIVPMLARAPFLRSDPLAGWQSLSGQPVRLRYTAKHL